MKRVMQPIGLFFFALAIAVSSASAQDDPKPDKPAFGDKDDVTLQNKRWLKIRNETGDTLTVFLQFRAPQEGGWVWIPDNPAETTDALSFEIEAGKELDVKHKDELVAASRMRIWASSPTQKWLQFKTKDCWLVPEKTEDGEHVYSAPGVETFTFNFSNDKDKGKIPGDTDMPGEQNLPTEGEAIPPPAPTIPWDDVPSPLPPDFPFVRDLAVMPVFTVGSNAMVRVKNLGHVSNNFGRRLIVKKLAPGSLPQDMGPIGPLFHYSVKTFFLVGLAPGNYVAFIAPEDDLPYDFNDKRLFSITGASYADAAVLPVGFAAGKVWVKIKNVGTAPMAAGRNLMTQKLPGGPLVDHGPIGPLAVNAIHGVPGFALAAGNYRAFVTPGDAAPHGANDQRFFAVAAAALPDFDVLPIFVSGGKATIKIKNVGLADAGVGAHLKTKKLPAGPLVDHGPIGALAVGDSKVFLAIPFAPGLYKAMVTPGDAVPLHGNDSEIFAMPTYIDRDILPVTVVGGMATIKVKNIGTANALAGAHLKTQKLPGGPIVDHGPIGAINAGDTKVFPPSPYVAGTYKAFIDPGDAVPYHFNDKQLFNVGTFIDHDILPVLVSSGKATIKVKNIGTANAPGGAHLKTQKLPAGPIVDHGPIGALNAGDTKAFVAIPFGAGNYKAFVSPGDALPYHLNDSQFFIVPTFIDRDILPIVVAAGKATIKVKNIGTGNAPAGAHLKTQKLPAGPIVDQGAIGALADGDTKTFFALPFAPGLYKAFISPGDAPPHTLNDTQSFLMPSVFDHDILPIVVAAGKATIKIKNIGAGNAPAGAHLKTQKLPGGLIVDHGAIGALNAGDTKTFLAIPFAPGSYKAFVSPGDAPPNNVNDSQPFIMPAVAMPDLEVSFPSKVGAKVKATIKNNGPGMYPVGGGRTWHLEKFVLGVWTPIPIIDPTTIPAIAPFGTFSVQGSFTGNGNYRIRITPGDSMPGNDTKTKVLP